MGGRQSTVEKLAVNSDFWRNRRVLVTGHTGFKGSWLCLWLYALGAKVTGIALPAEDTDLFASARISEVVEHTIGDITEAGKVREVVDRTRPQVIFHLAAQSLVLRSYKDPVVTYTTNVIGTAHVLEAARNAPDVEAIIVVTSDKCYDNAKPSRAFSELDAMGGADPYSSSKGCAELLTYAWRSSFFGGERVASVRAGNVIGGGDWAADRLVPDLVRGFAQGRPVDIRNPSAIRPWQHVLDPLCGYLMLAEQLSGSPKRFAEGWNFGPNDDSVATVAEVADRLSKCWGGGASWKSAKQEHAPHEAAVLLLNSSKARSELGWQPGWSLQDSLAATVEWYKAHARGHDMREMCNRQIAAYASPGMV